MGGEEIAAYSCYFLFFDFFLICIARFFLFFGFQRMHFFSG
jgi:hypothetical protein